MDRIFGRPFAVTFETAGAPLDGRWWDVAASRLLEFGARCGLTPRDLRTLTVLVPRISDRPWLCAALHRASGGADPWVAPRITTLERWVGVPQAPQTQRLVELFEALRASAWAREAFGDRPGALWALAEELARLGDELTLAAVGHDREFEGRWHDSVARHFQRRAATAASVQSQLVLQLWKAHASAQFGAGALLKQWGRRAKSIEGPLAWLAPFGWSDWQQVLLRELPSSRPGCVIVGDLPLTAASHGWLEPTWPELIDRDRDAPAVTQRSDVARGQHPPPLRIVPARSLEEEAAAAASEVERWLRAGVGRIALIAQDRLTARRVRALLERARILVADQAGWKLSTTSAAAAVMRWLELASADFRIRDLLDWLRSPFVLAGLPERAMIARLIDRVARSGPLTGGMRAIDRMLGRLDPSPSDTGSDPPSDPRPDVVAARAMLARLSDQARRLQTAGTLDRLAAALDESLDALGMREALARDPVGSDVLRELAQLRDSVEGNPARMSLAAFRELLAQHFENTNATDPGVESPVVMTSLAGACLRGFEAAVLIGADADHLPSAGEPGVLVCAGVRRDLGLPTAADLHHAQAVELATLLCSVPQVTATWRVREGDEPRALSPWLDRLRVMASRAQWPDPVSDYEVPHRTVVARATLRPAPSAPQRFPERLSVGACQSLVDCPYQFYARYLLGLRRRELAGDVPDKRDLGTALHSILHRLHRDFDPDRLNGMTDQELQRTLEQITQEVFERDLRERPALIAYRRRVLDLIPGYVAWLRGRSNDGWRLLSAETAFQLTLQLDLLRSVELSGRIDRIDRREAIRRNAVDRPVVEQEAIDQEVIDQEVIDYKARSHNAVRASAGDPGEDVQLPLYALGVGAQYTTASYLSFERASERRSGARSMSVAQFAAAEPFSWWVRKVHHRLCDDLARVAAGAGLPALGVDPICSRCEMRGLCRRNEWGDR
jgi:ATP-dependent helicase/nuclease subunit B